MKSFRLFWLLTVLALFTNCLCDGRVLCFENERLALLQFKDDLIDGANRLSSWSSANMDCCRWAGVVCNNVTGYVEELHLQGPDPELEEASSERLGGSINPSLLSLKQLKYLDLSCNDFQAIQIPSFIGSLQNLRYLNLSWSQFQGDVPPQLGNLSMLVVLDLRIGRWLSDFTVKRLNWLSGLSKLQYLDMSGYDLNNVSEWVQPIHTLPALTELHLSSCNLSQLPRNPTKFNFTSLTILDLSYNLNFFDTLMPRWIFSLSKLVSLDLSRCLFHGPVSGSGITNLNNLTDLKFLRVTENDFMSSPSVLRGVLSLKSLVLLDVSTCDISSPILGGLQNMTSLVSIDLSQNHIVETLPNSVGMLCNLIHVDLRSNNFSGSVSELLTNLSECKSPKLEYLAFSANRLSGSIPDKIGQLQNLVTFDLAFNAISGTIPYSLGRLSFLKELMLNVNSLSGPLPDSLGNLTSLYWLEISYNNFNGTLPESIGQLGNLNYLSVHHNSLTGVLTENHFANLTALDNIWAQANMLTLELSDKNWVPPFKLRVLRIGSWNLGPRFPSWLQSQGNLTDLDISNANISDVMPDWFWSTFSNIGFLNISHNRILGRFPQNLEFLATNAVVDLSDNSFDGPLPASLPDIDFLDLSRNHISGSLNQFLCPRVQESRQLKVLNLANNNLSGVIPDCWVNWDSLYVLNFENNRLSGGIPRSVGEVSLLRSLNMRKNNLTGKIPVSVMSSKSLLIIDLADNKLTGITPTANWRKATGLRLLSLRSNKLDGEFTDELCHLTSIQILDLAGNNLSGSLPTCFSNFTIMSGKESSTPIILYDEFVQDQVLGSASLVTKGREISYSTILFLVTTLDLSGNRFSGNIPGELMDLVGLRYLNLSGNQLTGGIPDNIGDMRLLESLDLSSNLLQGRIPWTISSLTFLNWLNISYNSLTGRIPTSTQIQSLNQSSFVGNRLCGPPLQDLCVSVAPVDRPKGEENTDEADEVDWVLIVCLVVGFFSGFWVVVGPLAVSKMWRITYFGFLYKVGHKVCGNCIPNPKHTTVKQTELHLESSW